MPFASLDPFEVSRCLLSCNLPLHSCLLSSSLRCSCLIGCSLLSNLLLPSLCCCCLDLCQGQLLLCQGCRTQFGFGCISVNSWGDHMMRPGFCMPVFAESTGLPAVDGPLFFAVLVFFGALAPRLVVLLVKTAIKKDPLTELKLLAPSLVNTEFILPKVSKEVHVVCASNELSPDQMLSSVSWLYGFVIITFKLPPCLFRSPTDVCAAALGVPASKRVWLVSFWDHEEKISSVHR